MRAHAFAPIFTIAFALLTLPVVTHAHGPTPAATDGGQVQEAAEHWVELVVQGDQVTAYVNELDSKPLSAKEWSGKATILVGGKTEAVSLTPADGNSANGKLAAPATGRVTAVLQLTIDGKAAQARFAITP